MVLDIYNTNIGVPPKCGSRFFSKTIPYWGEPEKRNFNDVDYNLDYIIVRNPLSHLKSALKTEILPYFNDKIKIGMILNTFSIENYGGIHFNPNFCQMVYYKWKKSEWKLKIIEILNLSKFIEEKLHHIEFNESDYDFHSGHEIKLSDAGYKNKQEIWDKCVELYPNKIKRLLDFTTEDTKWYNALLNNDRTLSPKILFTDYPFEKSLILYFGLTIEDAYTKKDKIKIYYRGILEVNTYLYVDNLVFTEAQSPFYYDDNSKQVFHIDLSSNIGMIIKITIKPIDSSSNISTITRKLI
jgi:hypothetical protein